MIRSKIDLATFSETNQRRNETSFEACHLTWSVNDWMTAIAGEVGEAANIAKKMRRGDPPPDAEAQLAKELADVVLYCDLLMTKLGRDLGTEVVAKFNEVSRRIGSGITMESAS